jgi:ribosomal protein S13
MRRGGRGRGQWAETRPAPRDMKVQTYNVMDMAKVMVRVNQLARENTALREQVQQQQEANADLQREHDDCVARLADLESYYARQRTAAVMLPIRRT